MHLRSRVHKTCYFLSVLTYKTGAKFKNFIIIPVSQTSATGLRRDIDLFLLKGENDSEDLFDHVRVVCVWFSR
ncbi:hypothetical protein OS493_031908 [Desmophyllum pertusum]|uniref:Uncharacterized protein n=1 Tax=Desmophyllum pertusum TaxID=174260 RepID=A0A9W9ZXN0_9CNID|nr:hypothetical protein OS493_031908 [Desmophyllum pertusum]